MIFKLKNAGLKFEKIEEITLNDNQIIDFINIPEKDNFSIEPNNLEQKKTANNDAQEKKIITQDNNHSTINNINKMIPNNDNILIPNNITQFKIKKIKK